MNEKAEETQLTKIETVFVFGIIGCMLLATWELAHLLADEWLYSWVKGDWYVRERIIYYAIAFTMSISSIVLTSRTSFHSGRFGSTVSRAFLWYGTLLLMSVIAFFIFDCLPEVFAGFIGTGLFIAAIYIVQRRFFSQERVFRRRLEKGECHHCGANLRSEAAFCSSCGTRVGQECATCGSLIGVMASFCWNCGSATRQENN